MGDIEDLDHCSLDLGSYGRWRTWLETLGDLVVVGLVDDRLDLVRAAVDDTVGRVLELEIHGRRCCSLVVDRGSVVVTCGVGHLDPLDPLGLENHFLDRSVGDG